MRKPPLDLEPAVRDPKKLATTGWTLVAIMIIGGFLVMVAYNKWSKKQSKDDRPAIVYRINQEKDLRMTRQDGKIVDLFDLNGKVILLNIVSLNHDGPASLSEEIMHRMAEKYAGNDQFALVSLVIDPIPANQLDETLKNEAEHRNINLPQWWLGSNEMQTLHKFIKNELKTGVFPYYDKKAGKWIYDTSIILVDKNRHIRRAVVHQKRGGQPYIATFDFDQAKEWDGRGVKTGTDLSNTQQLEALLTDTIDRVLAEPAQAP